MQIDLENDRFIARIRFEEREIFKSAGWTFDKDSKRWVTAEPKRAEAFATFASDAALERIKTWQTEQYAGLMESFATASDVDIPAPPGLEYDGYQKAGIVFASKRMKTLIADPPGLGKTIQAVGLSNYLPDIRRVLIIPPASLKINWQREWERWDVKGLSVGLADSRKRRERDETGKSRTRTIYVWPDADVVIINYDMIANPEFYSRITSVDWDLVVLDEAQYLVSRDAVRTKHVFGSGKWRKAGKWQPPIKGIRAKRWLALSGTPILSRPADMWTICRAFDPTGLGNDWVDYVYTYCAAHTLGGGGKDHAQERLDVSGASNLDDLQRKLRTRIMVRRPKSILSLPPKRHQLIPLPEEGLAKLVEAEMTASQRVREALKAFEGEVDAEPSDPYTGLYEALERRFAGWQDRSYQECIALLSEAEQVAFEEMSAARKALAAAKIPMVVEHLQNQLATGQKVICFVVHTEMADKLREAFPDAAFITGKTPVNRRQGEVDRFQEDVGCRLMIGNIVAAGVGFTMTASSLVVFAELDWSQARMEQAEDRAWRRGQTNSVLVQHLAVVGSLDARLVEVLLAKQRISRAALDHGSLPESHTLEQLLAAERDERLQITR